MQKKSNHKEEQFNIICDGLISHICDLQLNILKKCYKPKYDNSDISDYVDIDDFSADDQATALEDAKNCFIDEIREILPKENKAMLMIEKILESYSGR